MVFSTRSVYLVIFEKADCCTNVYCGMEVVLLYRNMGLKYSIDKSCPNVRVNHTRLTCYTFSKE